MGNMCLVLNLKNHALTQYHNFEFSSFAETSLGFVGSKPDGLYSLSYQLKDVAERIDASARLFDTDFNIPNTKRLRYLSFGMEATSDVAVTVTMDKKVDEAVKYKVPAGDDMSILTRVPISRDQYGRFIGLELHNVKGNRFASNHLDATIYVRNMNHR